MSRKPRVHEIAAELGVDSKAALATLRELGEFVKSPSSTIQPPVARKLRAALSDKQRADRRALSPHHTTPDAENIAIDGTCVTVEQLGAELGFSVEVLMDAAIRRGTDVTRLGSLLSSRQSEFIRACLALEPPERSVDDRRDGSVPEGHESVSITHFEAATARLHELRQQFQVTSWKLGNEQTVRSQIFRIVDALEELGAVSPEQRDVVRFLRRASSPPPRIFKGDFVVVRMRAGEPSALDGVALVRGSDVDIGEPTPDQLLFWARSGEGTRCLLLGRDEFASAGLRKIARWRTRVEPWHPAPTSPDVDVLETELAISPSSGSDDDIGVQTVATIAAEFWLDLEWVVGRVLPVLNLSAYGPHDPLEATDAERLFRNLRRMKMEQTVPKSARLDIARQQPIPQRDHPERKLQPSLATWTPGHTVDVMAAAKQIIEATPLGHNGIRWLASLAFEGRNYFYFREPYVSQLRARGSLATDEDDRPPAPSGVAIVNKAERRAVLFWMRFDDGRVECALVSEDMLRDADAGKARSLDGLEVWRPGEVPEQPAGAAALIAALAQEIPRTRTDTRPRSFESATASQPTKDEWRVVVSYRSRGPAGAPQGVRRQQDHQSRVRGHWRRNHHYPTSSTQKWIWIPEHVRGPAGHPLQDFEHVQVR